MKKIILSLLLFMLCNHLSLSQNINIGKRFNLQSNILNETRSYQVYLPPSYYSNPTAKYPVIYILDGDYNFHYDSGLIEFLSNGAFSIPEMIMIGISDKGGTKQLYYSDPKKGGDKFIQFIREELKPHVDENFRTASLNMLAGHSKFGLLVTHYWMKQHNDFDMFLAIDPSYWFNEYAIVKEMEGLVNETFTPSNKLWIAQANTQGMGIDEFVEVLKKNSFNEKYWKLMLYPNDNHGSLHLKSITDMLNEIFSGWNLSSKQFYKFKSSNDLVNYYKLMKDKHGIEFLLSWYLLRNVTNYYVREKQFDQLDILESGIATHFPQSLNVYYIQLANNYVNANMHDKAESLLNKSLDTNPNLFEAYDASSTIYLNKKLYKQAKIYAEKALQLARKNEARQWTINGLISNIEEIEKQLN